MYYYDPTYILLVPAIIFTLIAQAKVNSAFKRYSKVRNRKNLTGAEAARRMLDFNGLQDVRINAIRGNLTDHYNPKNRTLNLSESVFGVNSVAAVSVACHEAGHALQHAHGYTPLKLRNSIVPVVNFASRLAWPMIFIGILLLGAGSYEMGYFGMLLLDIGWLCRRCRIPRSDTAGGIQCQSSSYRQDGRAGTGSSRRHPRIQEGAESSGFNLRCGAGYSGCKLITYFSN